MITIQELGTSILSDTPGKFYVLGGSEYGVKDKYLTKLQQLYNGNKYEYPAVADVINMMNTRHLIPLQPSLYVVRYDEVFVSTLNESVANRIRSTKICGTLVCIYSDTKHISKIDKFLPEFTSQIEAVNPKFIAKYLKQDYPQLDDRCIQLALKCSSDYGHARTICQSLCNVDKPLLSTTDDKYLIHLFGCGHQSTDNEIRLGVAARNFNYLIRAISNYDGEINSLYYVILQTMIDIEKVLTSKYADVDIKEYKKLWKLQDVYWMFMHTYTYLINSRSSNTSATPESSLILLFALLTFKDIPSLEALNDF